MSEQGFTPDIPQGPDTSSSRENMVVNENEQIDLLRSNMSDVLQGTTRMTLNAMQLYDSNMSSSDKKQQAHGQGSWAQDRDATVLMAAQVNEAALTVREPLNRAIIPLYPVIIGGSRGLSPSDRQFSPPGNRRQEEEFFQLGPGIVKSFSRTVIPNMFYGRAFVGNVERSSASFGFTRGELLGSNLVEIQRQLLQNPNATDIVGEDPADVARARASLLMAVEDLEIGRRDTDPRDQSAIDRYRDQHTERFDTLYQQELARIQAERQTNS